MRHNDRLLRNSTRCALLHFDTELIIIVLILFSTPKGHASEFQNLGFDEPILANSVDVSDQPLWAASGVRAYQGTGGDFFPRWTVTDDLNHAEVTLAYQISNSFWDYSPFLGRSAILVPGDGGYAVYLCGDFRTRNGVSIRQTATIPTDALKLTFTIQYNPVDVRVDGQLVSLAFASDRDALSYGIGGPGALMADISAFAGRTVELSFSTTPSNELIGDSLRFDHSVIDDIAFVVPEPSTWTMFVLGLAAIRLNRLRNSSVNGPKAILKAGI